MHNLEDLTDVEHKLVRAVADGERLDLDGAEVRCDVIRRLLTGGFDVVRTDPRGIRVRRARLVGSLDLAEVESRLPLCLTDCHTSETVRLTGSRLSTVDLTGLVGVNIVAFDAQIERGLLMQNVRLSCASAEGTVSVGGARIGGVLDAAGSHLVNTHPDW
ncbi:MAG TPA: hypothetical protein VH352_26570, partial [Pseudonocardiaceae bacterium]|nr:hypothetical protein [Pseudonocardiaceae bacterium]